MSNKCTLSVNLDFLNLQKTFKFISFFSFDADVDFSFFHLNIFSQKVSRQEIEIFFLTSSLGTLNQNEQRLRDLNGS